MVGTLVFVAMLAAPPQSAVASNLDPFECFDVENAYGCLADGDTFESGGHTVSACYDCARRFLPLPWPVMYTVCCLPDYCRTLSEAQPPWTVIKAGLRTCETFQGQCIGPKC